MRRLGLLAVLVLLTSQNVFGQLDAGLMGYADMRDDAPLSSSSAGLPNSLQRFIRWAPKVELHVHVEGTLEPEMMMRFASRNGLPSPYPSVEAAR